VKAVVMTRDDSSGGWLPQEGGGLSKVGVCKVVYPEGSGRSGFLIHGERQKDKLVVLECFVKKDLVYTKANPTFHHWKVDNRKFGLTFQSPADARAFDRGVRKAIEDLNEGTEACISILLVSLQRRAVQSSFFTLVCTHLLCYPAVTVFSDTLRHLHQYKFRHMQNYNSLDYTHTHTLSLSLSLEPQRVAPLQNTTAAGERRSPPIPVDTWSFPDDDEEIVRINPREKIWMTGYEDYRHAPSRGKYIDADDVDSYVRFAKSDASKHDYNYPYVDSSDFDPGEDIKGAAIKTQPVKFKPRRKEDGERSRCVYCRDIFNHEENRRGQCQDAPDRVRSCIRRVSCMWCADSMLYHCMSDPEGDYTDPCSCDTSDEKFCLRWMALIALSFFAPCMCCYLPLRACYHCGVMCRCCGGKHKAAG
ncbi:Sprouty-related, EVH1 domain-containing protein 2, partial [Chelonia mydas]